MATILTSQIITKEAIRQISNNLVLGTRVDWSYSKEFGKSKGKIGATLDLRRPVLTSVVANNMAYSSAAANAMVETMVPLQVSSTLTSSFTFSDQERTLRIEDFAKRYLQSTCAIFASKFDFALHDAASNAGANTYNSAQVPLGSMVLKDAYTGVAGWVVTEATSALTRDTVAAAISILNEAACPDDGDRYGILHPTAYQQLALSNITLFNAQKAVSDIYMKGRIGEFMGVEWAWSNSCATHTNGAQASLVVSAGDQSVWTDTGTLTVTALAGAVNPGDVFQIATVKMVNPYSKIPTSITQQFTVVKAAAIGDTSVVVSPAPITSGAYQNIDAAVTGKTLALVGSVSTSYRESLILHKDAFCAAAPELEIPTGGAVNAHYERDDELNLGMRYISTYDAIGAAPGASGVPGWVNRLDVLHGARIVRGEWVVRIRS